MQSNSLVVALRAEGRCMMRKTGITVLFGALLFPAQGFSDNGTWITLPTKDGSYFWCKRLSKNLVLKEKDGNGVSEACARTAQFCTTPIRCYPNGFDGETTTGLVSCRARWSGSLTNS